MVTQGCDSQHQHQRSQNQVDLGPSRGSWALGLPRKAGRGAHNHILGSQPMGVQRPSVSVTGEEAQSLPGPPGLRPPAPLLLGTRVQAPPSAPASVLTQLDPHPPMDASQATPQVDGTRPRPLTLHNNPPSPAQSLEQAYRSPTHRSGM